jgi:hypothetical protein
MIVKRAPDQLIVELLERFPLFRIAFPDKPRFTMIFFGYSMLRLSAGRSGWLLLEGVCGFDVVISPLR